MSSFDLISSNRSTPLQLNNTALIIDFKCAPSWVRLKGPGDNCPTALTVAKHEGLIGKF